MQLPGVIGYANFLRAGKSQALAQTARQVPRHVVETKNDVLGGPDDRTTRRRAQNIVRGHHQHTSFDLSFH